MQKISVVIAVKNEEKNIRACLEAVKWADEIVIVDDCSSDGTAAICREYAGKVIVTDSGGNFHKNKNLGLANAAGDWLLSLDADEVVSAELRDEICARLASDTGGVDGFYIPRHNYFLGRRITGCGWAPDYIIRLFRKGAAQWPLDIHYVPRLADESRAGRLESPLIHYSYRSLEQYFEKFNRYTARLAGEARAKGVRVGAWNFITLFFIKPLFWFLRKYLFRKGFMDGFRGLFISLSSGLVIFVTYAKLWEMQENERS
ncbi:MAG TPA: hypothetical protein DCS63_05985 [Elusimicrobia bacterium]|nr:hypothetical protein [Elusimicrobiota bacterium]